MSQLTNSGISKTFPVAGAVSVSVADLDMDPSTGIPVTCRPCDIVLTVTIGNNLISAPLSFMEGWHLVEVLIEKLAGTPEEAARICQILTQSVRDKKGKNPK